jgi:hypothetical protein
MNAMLDPRMVAVSTQRRLGLFIGFAKQQLRIYQEPACSTRRERCVLASWILMVFIGLDEG